MLEKYAEDATNAGKTPEEYIQTTIKEYRNRIKQQKVGDIDTFLQQGTTEVEDIDEANNLTCFFLIVDKSDQSTPKTKPQRPRKYLWPLW